MLPFFVYKYVEILFNHCYILDMKFIIALLFCIGLSFANVSHLMMEKQYIDKGTEIIQSVNKKIDDSLAYSISSIIYQETEKYDIDFHFTLGVISAESRFNVFAKSYCGAIGLMQLMPRTAQYIAKKYDIDYLDLYDIESNIEIGVAYLSHLKRKYGTYELAAAGYNGGNGGALKYKEYMVGRRNKEDVPTETLKYVPKVMRYTIEYRRYTFDF